MIVFVSTYLEGVFVKHGRTEGWAEKESHDMIMKKWEERYLQCIDF